MVTTNRTAFEEAQALFGQALEQASSLARDLDTADSQVYRQSIALFVEAVRVVTPILKYVDKPIVPKGAARGVSVRGVRLSGKGKAEPLILSRKGEIVPEDSIQGGGYDPENHPFPGTSEEVAEKVLEYLQNLSKIFISALQNMEQRRRDLKKRSDQLQEAIAPFQRPQN